MKSPKIIAALLIFITFSGLAFVTLSKKSDDIISSTNRSIKHEEKSDYNNAISELQKIYNDNSGNYILNTRLGWLYYNKKDYQKSKTYYTKALAINKNSIEAMLGLTLPLSGLNDWEGVKQTYTSILKLDANNYTANLRLGQIFLNSGDYQQAKKYLEKAFVLYPSEYEPNLSLGWTLYYLGDKQKAKELFTSALMVAQNDSLASQGYELVK